MKVDVRQIENAEAQIDKMLDELRCACELLDEVSRSLRVQQVGSEESTDRIRASLLKERATLSRREEGLRRLRSALNYAAQTYEACERKARNYSTGGTDQIHHPIDLGPNPFIPRTYHGAIDVSEFRKTVESLISPFIV